MFANSIVMPNGDELPLQAGVERRYGLTESAFRDARNADATERADIFRVWLPLERPNTGAGNTEHPLTEAGRAALADWDPENDPALPESANLRADRSAVLRESTGFSSKIHGGMSP